MSEINQSTKKTDLGDFMKVFACTAVILQSVLAQGLAIHPSQMNQIIIGIIYDLTKFTAPVFIFGILYSTIRTTEPKLTDFPNYAKSQFSALLVPTFWWTLLYLLILPSVQQVDHYHNFAGFIWQFINGNAAPHLWYNTMMLQFIILMPLFWLISKLSQKSFKWALAILSVSIVIYLIWIEFYYYNIFSGSLKVSWYLLDRIFVSFFLYAVLGVLFVNYQKLIQKIIFKTSWTIIFLFLVSIVVINWELFKFGYPVKLENAPYYKLSMVLYDVCVILLIALLAYSLIDSKNKVLPTIHYLSRYAYRAYLSNVFWLVIIWSLLMKTSLEDDFWPLIIISYLSTWILSFASAILLNRLWTSMKHYLIKSK